MTPLLLGALAVSAALASIRWLRVAQREHYLAGAATRFALRWWGSRPANVAALAAACAGAAAAFGVYPAAFATFAAVAAGPFGLALRGRTSPLRWTKRLTRLAVAHGVLLAAAAAAVAVTQRRPAGGLALLALGVPAILDLAAAVARPVESRLSRRFVRDATRRVESVRPAIVAITGSYGKTTTKEYVRHLLAGRMHAVASPASFNNLLGLARAINETVVPGAEVFVAEMGTYGPGEIARMCAWLRPETAVVTAVGPVHLERFGSLDRTAAAKREILSHARTAVLNKDDDRVAAMADGFDGRVVWCSTGDRTATVWIEDRDGELAVHVDGAEVATVPRGSLMPSNLACAVGAAVAQGLPADDLAKRLPSLGGVPHRLAVLETPGGGAVIDDTYNSNPAGAQQALDLLAALASDGRPSVVVTPGMVELGRQQHEANRRFAAAAAAASDEIYLVGRTNRRALLEGARTGGATVHLAETRDEAVAAVKARGGPPPVVLYENDLPDHYP